MISVGSDEFDVKKYQSNLERNQISDETRPLVFIKRNGILRSRRGRGYSTMEISKAFANLGLGNQNIAKVRAFHIPVDTLRRSIRPENVKDLATVLSRHMKGKGTKNRGKRQSQTKDKTAKTKVSK
jgi:ribosomal protein L13E